jgi:hypothetical protein
LIFAAAAIFAALPPFRLHFSPPPFLPRLRAEPLQHSHAETLSDVMTPLRRFSPFSPVLLLRSRHASHFDAIFDFQRHTHRLMPLR